VSKEPEGWPISAASFKAEVEMAAGDLQTVSDILISIGHADLEVLSGWLKFFGRSVGTIADHLLEQAGRVG
jgi:hypothetical protein